MANPSSVVLEQVKKFLQSELAPMVDEMEQNETFPDAVFRKFFKSGFGTLFFPENYGGTGNLQEYLAIAEELGRIDLGFALSVLANSVLFGNSILRLGTEAQKKEYLPGIIDGSKIGCWGLTEPHAGSDARNVQTLLVKNSQGSYELTGSKTFITNAPVADYFIIIAKLKTEEDLAPVAVILKKGCNGLSVGKPLKKMGHRSSPTGEIFLERCPVEPGQILGTPGKAFQEVKKSLDIERAVLSSIALGAVDEILKSIVFYASDRIQFSRPILEFQLIQEKIAGISAEFEMLKVFRDHVIRKMENGEAITKEAAILKWRISRLGVRAADDAIQTMGGYGYMREYHVEKFYRDLKLYEIGGGTNEIQNLIIAKEVSREILGKSRI